MTINDIRNLAIKKKEELIKSGDDLKEIDSILILLNDDMCFLKLDINIAIPILLYLGISEDKIKEIYYELISFKNYQSGNKVRTAFDIK